MRSITAGARPVSRTRKPSSLKIPRSDDRIRSSSSTTSTVSFTLDLSGKRVDALAARVRVASASCLANCCSFNRKLKDESTSARAVVAHPDEAVMVGDDGRNNRQAEPGAACFWSRKYGSKIRDAQRRIDSGTVVAHFQRHHPAGPIQPVLRISIRGPPPLR